ncbi:uncharacterized protein LOC121523555 isoform X2 [Cheilinus undulatus]|uniref:uncharacterized protein LOC121523555 isoform X2 n=1 Tax=Cheilinus undulatus TaxID=241271 RepID=UPI001BD47789|nr:uncharacterized protein LOC121523555 isoform X2 [Cheilinus undulatus]
MSVKMSGFDHSSDFPMEVKQLLVHDEEVLCEQQEQSSGQNQVVSIKEEPEELWSSQEGEQLQGSGPAGISMFTFVPIPVKSEYEENPQFSLHHHRQSAQMETGADEENSEGAEATSLGIAGVVVVMLQRLFKNKLRRNEAETRAGEENSGGQEAARNSDPERHS